MKLEDFLARSEEAELCPTQPVSFRVVGLNKRREPVQAQVSAQLVFVNEQDMRASRAAAAAALAKLYPGGAPVTDENIEYSYQLLTRALRSADEDGVAVQFCSDADALRRALVAPEANRLIKAYWDFVEREFPSVPTEKQTKELEEEALKNS